MPVPSIPGASFHPTEPSWTGPRPSFNPVEGPKHLQRWICDDGNRCTPYVEQSFTDNINWRIFRIMAEFVEGFDFLAKLHREVTFFGSARTVVGSKPYELARRLAYLLGNRGFSVITGGGPGIMEAGNLGAHEAGAESVGLCIALPMEQRRNQYVSRSMAFNYFFTRKVMLSASAQAYVFFPGGFGTLDELFEVATLIQTQKMSRSVPIILMDRAFWRPMLEWIRQAMWHDDKYIDREDLDIFQVVDTPEEAFAIIAKTKERQL